MHRTKTSAARSWFVLVAVALVLGVATRADAAVCNVTQCTSQLMASGVLVDDIFHDGAGHTAAQLPQYGHLIDPWPGCPEHIDFAGAGSSLAPFDCPGQYVTTATTPTLANAHTFLDALDNQWWQPCRLANPTQTGGCIADWSCIADGAPGNYLPWTGLVFDLGGPANQLLVLGTNDHGPQPCESLEYTVFFTDNPFAHDATDIVLDPATSGIDPMRWNRAALSRVYTQGNRIVRPADPVGQGAACGDTASYSVEMDSFAQVFALPCGATMRYAVVVAGNDGRDFASCAYDSNEGEIDAVAGLTAAGVGVCPDGDHDGYVDCNCPGAPSAACDCNDADPTMHPGASETCDATTDANCDGTAGSACASGTRCVASRCSRDCDAPGSVCPSGTTCTSASGHMTCVPADCGCAPGEVCVSGSCVSSCTGITCPLGQTCRDGDCVDPCAGIVCAEGRHCESGACALPCGCFAGNTGCATGQTCDPNGGSCLATACASVSCGTNEQCDPMTGSCGGVCTAGVSCPTGEHCVEPSGCVPLCTGVTCTAPSTCNPSSGACDDPSCRGVACTAPAMCVAGACVSPDAGIDASRADAGASDAGARDASASDASASMDSGSVTPPSNAGCGCRAGHGPHGLAALVTLVLALLTRRVRR